MLIGVVGGYAIGKTTFLKNYMDIFADELTTDLHAVCADLGDEYHLDGDSWVHIKNKDWCDTREHKLRALQQTRDGVWIAESARYFSGIWSEAALCNTKFVVLITTPELLSSFIQQRCASKHKQFNANYWTYGMLKKYAIKYYTNPMIKYMQSDAYKIYEVDASRHIFSTIAQDILHWLHT